MRHTLLTMAKPAGMSPGLTPFDEFASLAMLTASPFHGLVFEPELRFLIQAHSPPITTNYGLQLSVEVAGIEPASEGPSEREYYVRSL